MARTSLAGALAAWTVLAAAPADGWQVRISRAASTGPVAVDAHGDILVVLRRRGEASEILKLARDDGSRLWHRTLVNPERRDRERIGALAVSPEGDVFVGGRGVEANALMARGFLVERLSGRAGVVRWRRVIPGVSHRGLDFVYALAVDARGDVLAAGRCTSRPFVLLGGDFTVVKLTGGTGLIQWHFWIAGNDDGAANAIAVTADDDVVAAGTTSAPADGTPLVTVIKLRGASGELIWRRDLEMGWRVHSVAVDGVGNVLVAAGTLRDTGHDFGVFKLSAAGEVQWEARISGGSTEWEEAREVIALPSNDVAALGVMTRRSGRSGIVIVRLDGATGRERWRRLMRGVPAYGGGASLLALPNRNLIVGGQTPCGDVSVARLSAATGRVLGRLRFDGSETVVCDRHPDELAARAADHRGRVIVAGGLVEGPRGHGVGFVTSLPPGW